MVIQQWMDDFCKKNISTLTFCHLFNVLTSIFFLLSVNKDNNDNEVIEIPDVMFNTARLRQRYFYDEILLTLSRQPLQQVDSAVTQGVSV